MTSEVDKVRTIDLMVRGAIQIEVENTKDMIETISKHSKGNIWFLSDEEEGIYTYFKGFFSGILVAKVSDRITGTIEREGPSETEKISKIGSIFWYEVNRFLDKHVDRYFEELRLIARSQRNQMK